MFRAIVRASGLRPAMQLASMTRLAGGECLSQPAQSQSRHLRGTFTGLRECGSFAWQRTPHRRWQQAIPLEAGQHCVLFATRARGPRAAVSQAAKAVSDFQSDTFNSQDSLRCILPELPEDLADSFGDTLLCFGATAVRCFPPVLHRRCLHKGPFRQCLDSSMQHHLHWDDGKALWGANPHSVGLSD